MIEIRDEDIINLLFKRRYRVKVPVIATYSDEELRVIGLPIPKINDVKKKIDYTELSTVHLTINEMLDIFKNGYPIYISNRDTASFIYKVIDRHLSNWRYRTTETLNMVVSPPEDDLIALDKFANEIFENNKLTVAKSVYKEHNNPFDIGLNLMGENYNNDEIDVKKIKRTSNVAKQPKLNKNSFRLDDLLD